ncbi:MAG: hypothetical protein H6747_06725 [Deltaproteobacteria bacterium]|nr:hypothetical protein [Deltaproteobacteria bacterium]
MTVSFAMMRRAALACVLGATAVSGCGSDGATRTDELASEDATKTGKDAAGATDDGATGDGSGPGDGRAGGMADGAASADAGPQPLPCKSDKDCIASDQVCDKDALRCVDCNGDVDCPSGESCKAHTCVPPATPCTSSKDCAALEQVCDKKVGSCVDCMGDEDCLGGALCVETICVAKACTKGQTRCGDDGALQLCASNELRWTTTQCPAGQSCTGGACGVDGPDAADAGSDAAETTAPDAATPDATTPDATTPDTATPDTATPDTTTPDTATPDTTTPDASETQLCAPNSVGCDGLVLQICAGNGSAWQAAGSCADSDPCTTDSCTPDGCKNLPAADGTACGEGKVCTAGSCGPAPNACGADAAASCNGKCGSQGTGGCWCDTLCKTFSNCCKDFDACCGG